MRDFRILPGELDPPRLVDAFSQECQGNGGLCSFVGNVRPDADVEALELTHYEPLTLNGMNELADSAFARFDLIGLLMVHRVGLMQPGDPIVCVAAAARHRRDAILAVDYCMDHLKSAAWFWKRERRADGWHWIEPRADDYADRARWEK